MKLAALALAACLTTVVFAGAKGATNVGVGDLGRMASGALAAPAFTQNMGQWNPAVRFAGGSAAGPGLWITGKEVVISTNPSKSSGGSAHCPAPLRLRFLNGSLKTVSGSSPIPGLARFFVGNDRSEWVPAAPRFASVVARDVYPGIAVRFYYQDNRPRFDLLLDKGVDPSVIAIRFDAAASAAVLPSGNICFTTARGPVELGSLTAYQTNGAGTRSIVACRMSVRDNVIRFSVPRYDRRRGLVIDPAVSATFLGGGRVDIASGSAMDSTGNIVVVGSTLSLDFPLTSDAYDNSNVAGPQGATIGFIAKVSSDGSKLVYSTYFGGAAYGGGYGSTINAVAVDPATGNILVAGTTYSNTFPTTSGVLQTTNLGAAIGHCTAFVSEFDPTGATLLWSTYLGGRGNYYGDYANACAFDASSDPVIAGATFSSDFPTTTGCPQASNHAFAAFECNAFVTKLNPSGTTLLSSTYLGGSIEDGATSVAVDSSGHIFVAGQSYSGDFPVSTSAYQKSNKAIDHGACNGFVTELSADGKTVLFSTLLGGSGGDAITALALDSIGEPTVAGWTYSKNFPVTANAYQRANAGVANHASNAFVTKIKSNGKGLVYSTYLGGSGLANGYGDQANALAFDAADDPMVVGSSFSGNFPTTPNSGQQNNAGFANSVDNAFLVQLNSTATSLLYSSYYGGSGSSEPNNWFQGDSAVAIVPVSSSQFDMVGTAYSYSLPAASAGFQTGTNGPPDVFLTDFRIW